MRSKWFYVLAFVVLLVVIVVVAVLAVKGFSKKSEPVVVQTSQPVITAPSTTATTTTPRNRATTSAQTQQTQASGDADTAAVIAVAKASARANNPSVGELNVLASKVVDGWARVDMQPVDRSTDAASWLLKKTNGQWVVIDFGTSVMPSDHPDAPAELFQ